MLRLSLFSYTRSRRNAKDAVRRLLYFDLLGLLK